MTEDKSFIPSFTILVSLLSLHVASKLWLSESKDLFISKCNVLGGAEGSSPISLVILSEFGRIN